MTPFMRQIWLDPFITKITCLPFLFIQSWGPHSIGLPIDSGEEANNLVNTLTSDNGKEFASHERVVARLGGAFYFATPYHSWERGLNEHTNGLVRQYFPKGTDFTLLTEEDVARVEQKINNRPRKILKFETPVEAFLRMTDFLPSRIVPF